jgi:hypothetical protein
MKAVTIKWIPTKKFRLAYHSIWNLQGPKERRRFGKKYFWAFSIVSCRIHIVWHVRLKFFLVFIYRCKFHLVPKASWTKSATELHLHPVFRCTLLGVLIWIQDSKKRQTEAIIANCNFPWLMYFTRHF